MHNLKLTDENLRNVLEGDKELTKEQAIQAMKEGNAVAHRYFGEGEYVKMNEKGLYEFEDGVTMSSNSFWLDRTSLAFHSGWSIVEPITA